MVALTLLTQSQHVLCRDINRCRTRLGMEDSTSTILQDHRNHARLQGVDNSNTRRRMRMSNEPPMTRSSFQPQAQAQDYGGFPDPQSQPLPNYFDPSRGQISSFARPQPFNPIPGPGFQHPAFAGGNLHLNTNHGEGDGDIRSASTSEWASPTSPLSPTEEGASAGAGKKNRRGRRKKGGDGGGD